MCNDLDRSKCRVGLAIATSDELRSTAQRGCHSCSLTLNGISGFCDSLPLQHRAIFNNLNIQRTDIMLPKDAPLLLNLHFILPDGGSSSVLLELFSTTSKLGPSNVIHLANLAKNLTLGQQFKTMSIFLQSFGHPHWLR